MTIKIENGEIRLSSGRVMHAHGGVLGLRYDSYGVGHPTNAFRLTAGYDNTMSEDLAYPDADEDQLTAAERHEIASFMANLWLRWGPPVEDVGPSGIDYVCGKVVEPTGSSFVVSSSSTLMPTPVTLYSTRPRALIVVL